MNPYICGHCNSDCVCDLLDILCYKWNFLIDCPLEIDGRE